MSIGVESMGPAHSYFPKNPQRTPREWQALSFDTRNAPKGKQPFKTFNPRDFQKDINAYKAQHKTKQEEEAECKN